MPSRGSRRRGQSSLRDLELLGCRVEHHRQFPVDLVDASDEILGTRHPLALAVTMVDLKGLETEARINTWRLLFVGDRHRWRAAEHRENGAVQTHPDIRHPFGHTAE